MMHIPAHKATEETLLLRLLCLDETLSTLPPSHSLALYKQWCKALYGKEWIPVSEPVVDRFIVWATSRPTDKYYLAA